MTANQAVEITAYRFESHYDRTFPHTILRNAALPGGLSPLSIAKNMRLILIPLLIAFTAVVSAEEDQRTGAPKDCYLYSWGKGPNWTAEISTEFRLSLLNRQMPYVDDQYSEPTEKAFTWIERQKEPVITTPATVDGRRVIEIVYPDKGSFGKTIGTILLAVETAPKSEWFAPFFVAQPELFRGRFVSGRDVSFGYIATLEWSGTGSFRKHFLYDLRKPHPVILSSIVSGRVVRTEFKTDQEHEEALKIFDREADLLAGIIPETKTTRPTKGEQGCAGQPAEELVVTMTDKTAAWDARCTAEDSLTNLPPQKILPLLLPHIGKGMPSPPICNSAGRDFDKTAPVEWQIFYAVARSWSRQVDSLPRDSGGTLLLALLGAAKVANERSHILMDLTHRWVPEAEVPVAALLKAPEEDLAVRTTAALALVLHGSADYHRLLIDYAETGSFADRKRWFDLLSDPRHKKRTGVDPRVVQMGFALILEDREVAQNYVHGAYFLAIKTGDYVGQEFKPDQRDSRYQGEHALTDSFFADTVKNATGWGTKNRARIEKELQTSQIQHAR